MNIVRSFSRRSFFWLLILTILLVAILDAFIYLGADYIFTRVPMDQLQAAAADAPALKAGMDEIQPVIEWIPVLFFPVTLGLFFFFFLISWFVVRSILVRVVKRENHEAPGANKAGTEKISKKKKTKKEDGEYESGLEPVFDEKETGLSKREAEDRQRRYYLHLLSVLQREGRLVDFLTEDLAPYDDAQIGAAVRSIHENCQKSLEKYLSPKFVMDKNEGEPVTIPPEFDSNAIKLTGNVTGEPPFSGVLRHRGWRAGKLELPELTGTGDAKIIAPAEVEIP
ncbi:MAG: DUF2760 domain-containing protein [Desulfosalsimonadaceae bacterium]